MDLASDICYISDILWLEIEISMAGVQCWACGLAKEKTPALDQSGLLGEPETKAWHTRHFCCNCNCNCNPSSLNHSGKERPESADELTEPQRMLSLFETVNH